MEYIVLSLRVSILIDMVDEDSLKERLLLLLSLEEHRFIAGFNQQLQKERAKAWYDRHIKSKAFKEGDLVLLYVSLKNFLVSFVCIGWVLIRSSMLPMVVR